jgi:hypothetical protein
MDNSVLNALGGGTNASVDKAVASLQPILTAGLVISIILTIIFSVYLIVSYVHKWKVQSAILRIDKNLQKLVDFQIGPDQPVPVEVHDIKEKPLEPIEEPSKNADVDITLDDESAEK